jgi:alpha-ketoglutarate-dependent taurine dioxygenase
MKTSVYDSRHNLPLMFEPETQEERADLRAWCEQNKAFIDESLAAHGAILFRGFGVGSELKFEQVVRSMSDEVSNYVDGNSPRTKLSSSIYTSTEYPQEFFISLHNELSYAGQWPARLFFCCLVAAEQGGGTALADCRRILNNLDASVVREFREKRIKYLRNLHGGTGFGQSWQQTFETADPCVVEEFLKKTGTSWQWKADGSLHLSGTRPATAYHPLTGEEVWFNQADQFHPSTHPKDVYEMMLLLYDGKQERLPQNAVFGDGSPIPEAALDHVRATASEQLVDCRWRPGDVLIVDNMLVCHGRMPFTGKRRVLVAMSGAVGWDEVVQPHLQTMSNKEAC